MFLSSANTIDWVNHQGEQQFGLDRVRDQGTPSPTSSGSPISCAT
jgi:hypothetical protein